MIKNTNFDTTTNICLIILNLIWHTFNRLLIQKDSIESRLQYGNKNGLKLQQAGPFLNVRTLLRYNLHYVQSLGWHSFHADLELNLIRVLNCLAKFIFAGVKRHQRHVKLSFCSVCQFILYNIEIIRSTLIEQGMLIFRYCRKREYIFHYLLPKSTEVVNKKLWFTEEYLKPNRTSKMELFAKIVNGFQHLTIFAKCSILGFEYASGFQCFAIRIYMK